MRSKPFFLIATGLTAFLVCSIAWLPASMLAYWLPPSLAVGHLAGTVWNGSADSVAIGNRALGALEWQLHPVHLLRGRLALDARLSSPTSSLQGWFALRSDQSLEAREVQMRSPLSALPIGALPAGWSAETQAKLQRILVENRILQDIVGVIELHHLQQPPPTAWALGSYRLSFDEGAKRPGKLIGQLQDIGGPLQVRGTVTFGANRELIIDAHVAPRASAPRAMVDALRFLGEPGPQGERPFSLTASY